jgi:hypothetical protein
MSTALLATMLKFLRNLAFTAAAVALAGCATPRYQTIYRYEPAAGVEGQACVKGCEQALTGCRAVCQSAWQVCTARAETQVEERYAQALKAYAADLSRYRRELDRYEWDLWMGWGHEHGGLWYSTWHPYPWHGYYPRPNPPAEEPTREAVRAGVHREQCKDDCGCQFIYDDCHQGCGGRKVPETRCVADCPTGSLQTHSSP